MGLSFLKIKDWPGKSITSLPADKLYTSKAQENLKKKKCLLIGGGGNTHSCKHVAFKIKIKMCSTESNLKHNYIKMIIKNT